MNMIAEGEMPDMEGIIQATKGVLSSGAAVAVLVILVIILFRKPLKLALKLVLNMGLGFAGLALTNVIAASFGIEPIGVNWLNAAVVGLLGVPGLAVLYIVRYFL